MLSFEQSGGVLLDLLTTLQLGPRFFAFRSSAPAWQGANTEHNNQQERKNESKHRGLYCCDPRGMETELPRPIFTPCPANVTVQACRSDRIIIVIVAVYWT